jgi:hypothetical protein
MKKLILKGIAELYTRQWVIGVARGDIKEIIRSKTFDPAITWLPIQSRDQSNADPFLFKTTNGGYDIFFEDYSFKEGYGKLAVMTIGKNFKPVDEKLILDSKSHLSYPFIFIENNRTYVIPESAQIGKLSCYEYDPLAKSLSYLQPIIDLPLLDATILKQKNKYWVFGIVRNKEAFHEYLLCVFYADSLLGPYTPHPTNPVRNSLNGTRSAGNFIEVDGVLYRPTQNCENRYGESITINKVNVLNEQEIDEEFYMSIAINKKNKNNYGIQTIHTINVVDDMMVVDGIRSRFSLLNGVRQIARKIYLRGKKRNKIKSPVMLFGFLSEWICTAIGGKAASFIKMGKRQSENTGNSVIMNPGNFNKMLLIILMWG